MHALRAPLLGLLVLLSSLLSGLLAACRPEPAAVQTGGGLQILPYDGPLAPGVLKRDPRPFFHDFGVVPDGETVTRVFRLRNTDPAPVAITRVDPGCGCTVAALRVVHADGTVEAGEPVRSKAPKLLTIPSGDVAELEVKVETRDLVTKNTHKLITIRVLTDSPNGYFLSFEVHLYAQQPFAIVPGTLLFGDVPESGGGSAKVEIVPAGTTLHELGEIRSLPAGVTADVLKEIRQGRPVWVLSARLEPPLVRGLPRGLLRETLRLATVEPDGAPGRELEVPLTANVVGDLLAEPQRLAFRAASGASASAELFSLLAGHRLRLMGVEVPEAHRALLEVRYEPVEAEDEGASERWRITLLLRADLPGPEVLSGTLTVRLDDLQHPSYPLDYVIHPPEAPR